MGAKNVAVANAFHALDIETVIPSVEGMPNASMIARLAAEHIRRGEINPLEPLYFADPIVGQKKKSG